MAVSEKFRPFTIRVTVAECVSVPLIPVIVTVKVPVGVALKVATVSVDVPEPVTDPGAKAPVAPAGNPLTKNVAVPVKPFTAVTVVV